MSFWAKVRLWTKISVFSAVAIYLLIFAFLNTGQGKQVTLWVWFGHEPTAPVLAVLPLVFLMGVIATLLTRTVFRTLRQLREMRRRKMEKEAAAIITRAAKLRVREQQQTDAGRGFDVVPASDTRE